MRLVENLLEYESVEFCRSWVEFYEAKIKVPIGPFCAGEQFDMVKLLLISPRLRFYRFLREFDGSVCGEIVSPDFPVDIRIEPKERENECCT